MNAIAQLRPNRAGSPDPALLLAAVHAFSESLAIVASGVVVYANPAWCDMFECPNPAQILGRPVEDSIPEHCAFELVRAGFQMRGKAFQVIHASHLSRQKQSDGQLRESQRLEAVGRLVGGVAHDFNNLLTGIMLYCDLLIGELKVGSGPRRHVQEMRLAGEHGAALVQQLLAASHPPAEESRVASLNDVVTAVEGLLIRLMGENIVLNTALASDLGAVKMDPAQVQQILLNLVLNARDAMPDGGRITITTRNCTGPFPIGPGPQPQVASWVELTVADTGCGMNAETLDRAFEPFFTTKKPGRGTGLGLATARRLAGHEDGTIVAESEPGKGTRISVRLPRVQPDTSLNSKEVIS